jgi:ABC-type multidrug transport system ATPase subunit
VSAFLALQDLGFAWPGQPALFRSLTAALGPGLGLLCGDEQTGKTTLMRLLAGELHPDAGSLVLAGRSIGAGWAGFRPDMVRPELDPAPVGQWLREQVPEGPARDRLEDSLDGLSLREHLPKTFHMLSAGGRRKVGLAAAMALQPPLTLLDQPFSALDLPSIRFMTAWLNRQSQATDRLVLVADYEATTGLQLTGQLHLGASGR